MKQRLLIILIALFTLSLAQAQKPSDRKIEKMERKLNKYFSRYRMPDGNKRQPTVKSWKADYNRHTLTVNADATFAQQQFTQESVDEIYRKLGKALPKPFRTYKITIYTGGTAIERLISGKTSATHESDWGDEEYKDEPWVRNASTPLVISNGLQDRHIALWASHGRYYDQKKAAWKWQRPALFGTTEDLFTQTIVVPYLMPMLERAGAVVFSPRERDWQKAEYIIDNDTHPSPYYIEGSEGGRWINTGMAGFRAHAGSYADLENPFTAGTARACKATSKDKLSTVSWQPNFAKGGKYAVYVSYQTVKKSVSDAQYLVYHKGQVTEMRVNQRMGSGTWVYLGTFEFDRGCSKYNRVVLTNSSEHKGVVTADAVRFGGGMGNITRGGTVSGLPRCLEGARYYAQWAGAPAEVVSHSNGENDYNDDINSRSMMSNWLAGGSVYNPNTEGKGVPLELSLAVHSDAGYNAQGLIGTLAICTTTGQDGTDEFGSGASRSANRALAQLLLNNTTRDLQAKYGQWTARTVWDRNYSETRRPDRPSAILETLAHQNFNDMRYGLDPNFRFTLARSVYKTLLRYINGQHGRTSIVQPLAPNNFSVTVNNGKAFLSWQPVKDAQEPTAEPTAYMVYISMGFGGFDNGTLVNGRTCEVDLKPGVLYNFRVSACNRGGESFPTEVLSAVWQPGAKKTVLVVNGFHRLSSPALINNETQQGFDIDLDPGVTYGPTAGWAGRQQVYDRSMGGQEGPSALGYTGSELEGMFIAGNDFNYVRTHAEAIRSAAKYNIVSCSSEAVESGRVKLTDYGCVDLLLGLERDDGHSLVYYKTFTPTMQRLLNNYTSAGGRLLVSGSYVGSDMQTDAEQQFLARTLKVSCAGNDRLNSSESVSGLSTSFSFYRHINEDHYAANAPDVLQPVNNAFTAMTYADGRSAAVASRTSAGRTFTMGFPLECIKETQTRKAIMRGILSFLLK